MPPGLIFPRADVSARLVGKISNDRSGSVVVVFAIALIPLMLGLMLALDYARMASTQRSIQASLDAAVLAGVNSETGDKVGVAQRFFTENTMSSEATGLHAAFSIATDGTMTGTAAADLPLLMGGFLQNKAAPINVTAAAFRASERYESFTFTPTSAQGTFNKDIYVVTRDATGAVVKSDLAIAYSYDAVTGTRSTAPATGNPVTVTLPTYNTVSFMMRVWWQNPGTRFGAYTDYYSDDTSARLQTHGTCNTGQANNWEDGGDSNYVDFVYSLSCKPAAGSNQSWLVK